MRLWVAVMCALAMSCGVASAFRDEPVRFARQLVVARGDMPRYWTPAPDVVSFPFGWWAFARRCVPNNFFDVDVLARAHTQFAPPGSSAMWSTAAVAATVEQARRLYAHYAQDVSRCVLPYVRQRERAHSNARIGNASYPDLYPRFVDGLTVRRILFTRTEAGARFKRALDAVILRTGRGVAYYIFDDMNLSGKPSDFLARQRWNRSLVRKALARATH
jgi:hypothetical protein